jgi:hypothetical protein
MSEQQLGEKLSQARELMVRHGVSLMFIDAGPDRPGYYEARLSGHLVAAAASLASLVSLLHRTLDGRLGGVSWGAGQGNSARTGGDGKAAAWIAESAGNAWQSGGDLPPFVAVMGRTWRPGCRR